MYKPLKTGIIFPFQNVGKTCLHNALDRNHADIVKILLAANPDLEIKTNDGDTGKYIQNFHKSIQAHLDIRNFQSL